MEEAIAGWKNKDGKLYQHGLSKNKYMKEVEKVYNIKRSTLKSYITDNDPKIFVPGNAGGRKRTMSPEEEDALVQSSQRKDRANNGDRRKDVYAKMQRINPELSIKQCKDTWNRTIQPSAVAEKKLKSKVIKAQRTTTARSKTTVEQQWRFHYLVDSVDADHRTKNVDDVTGVSFINVEIHAVSCLFHRVIVFALHN